MYDESENNEEFVELDIKRSESAYVSPILKRVDDTRLTVDLLRELVPVVRAGQEAQDKLEAGRMRNPDRIRELRMAIRSGEKAKERLFNAALPLIRTIVQKEYRRRQQWGSQIPMDDLMQDAIIGFFKGLRIFDTHSINKSATNYLGQWMLSEMRRAAESMDHDLQIGHDAGERFRRIRAIRSRLAGELGREPTDQEIVDASTKPEYSVKPGMVGRVSDANKTGGKAITLEQIADEKANRDRLGSAARITSMGSSDDMSSSDSGSVVEVERLSGAVEDEDEVSEISDPALLVSSEASQEIIAGLVRRVMGALSLPEQQIEIISRRYGLAPYDEEQSARSISKEMGIHREKIARILTAFSREITTPGATLHQLIKDFAHEDLYDLGLGWLADSLGEWQASFEKSPHDVSPELTRSIITKSQKPEKRVKTDADKSSE